MRASHRIVDPTGSHACGAGILCRHSPPVKRLLVPLVLAVSSILSVTALTGCDTSGTPAVRFWCGFTGPDGRTMLRMIQTFNEQHPETRVLMQRMDWGTYYNKLFVAGMGGRAPEVFISHIDNLERFLQAGFIEPIDDLISGPEGIDTEDLLPHIWAAVERDGKHYGLPLDVHPQGLFYNKRLFSEAGITNERGEPVPPTDRESFLRALEILTRDTTGDGRTDQWGFVFTWFRTNMVTFIRQFGGRFFTPDLQQCVLTDEATVAALEFCASLIRRGLVPSPEHFDSWIGFRQGRVAMAFEGIYMLADLEKQTDLEWGAAVLPVIGEQPATWASSHIMCMRAGLDDETRQAAWRLMRFLSDHALDWAEGGQAPVRLSQLESARFKAMQAQAAFAEQSDYIAFMPPVPFIFEFFTEFDRAVERTLRGSVMPFDALLEAEEAINAAIARHQAIQARIGGGGT